jgi:hypothetical protein
MKNYSYARKVITESQHRLARKPKLIKRTCSTPVLTKAQEEKYFMSFVKRDLPTTDCWLWTGPTSQGYGIYRGKRAHHFLLVTKPNRKEMACHHCDNRNCVKPSHIYIGSAKTNSEDVYKKTNLNSKRRHENFLARSTLLE